MKKIVIVFLFIFVAGMAMAQEYEINKYAMNYDERETIKVYAAVLITFVLIIALFWSMSMYTDTTSTLP